MAIKNITVKQATCERCGHKWQPRQEQITICPDCKSPYWNKKRLTKSVTAQTAK